MADFHEVRISVKISYGAVGGPQRRTDIVTLANGFEERNSPWAHARHRYDISYGIRSLDQAQEIVKFFHARYGQLYGFRYKDWGDYKSCTHSEAVKATDMVQETHVSSLRIFALTKTYADIPGGYTRPITKPVAGTVKVAIDGVPVDPDDVYVDTVTGWVLLTVVESALSSSMVLTAGFEFDVPVRFDTDWLNLSLDNYDAGALQSIPLVEVKTEAAQPPQLSSGLLELLKHYSLSDLLAIANIVDYTVNTHWETTWS